MPNSFSAPATRLADIAVAEVRAHDHVMRYRRRGVGPGVLVLLAAEEPDALWPGSIERLAECCRVIVPELPEDRAGLAAWLGDFLEGIGVDGVAIVAAGSLCVPAVEFGRLDEDRIARIALVAADMRDEAGLVALASGDGAMLPLLVVPRSAAPDEALPALTRFLACD